MIWRSLHRDERGISLAELMVTLVIVAIVGSIMITWVAVAYRVDASHSREISDQVTIRLAKSRLVKEVRWADELLDTSTSYRVDAWFDDNGNDVPDTGVGEIVTWELIVEPDGSGTLRRLVDLPSADWEPHAVGLRYGPMFTYNATPPSAATSIELFLVGGGQEHAEITGHVTLRRL